MYNIFKNRIFTVIRGKLKFQPITKLKIITLTAILIKTMLFLAVLEAPEADKLNPYSISFEFTLVHLAFIGIFFSFIYLLSGKKQTIFSLTLNAVYTLILILDLWYFRVNRDFYGLKDIFFNGTFNPMGKGLIRPEPIDIIFIVDIVLILFWVRHKRIYSSTKRSFKRFAAVLFLSAAFIYFSYIWIDVEGHARWDKRLFKVSWSTAMMVRAPGPIGYHAFEIYNTLGKVLHKEGNNDVQAVKQWLSANTEQVPENQYKSIFKGKNVIFLQLESFENFIINKKVNGKEITPFLNRLTSEGLYFNNFYEQNNAGNSIDCDFMVNTSILPLGEAITALNFGERVYPNSLPRLLKDKGYITVTSHAEEPGEFNWTELHKNSFGVDKLWDLSQYNYEETVGYGLSDKSFLSQLEEKIKTLPQPFFLQAPTLSNHGPFELPDKYRVLGLPTDIDRSYLGGYFESAHYTDEQIEMFFKKLDSDGLLNNTVIVIYGDHTGVHKYYDEDILKLSFEGDWWKPYDHKIPLIIYSKGISPKVFENSGGQIDIMPTMSYMLGIEDSKYMDKVMGRVLVDTQKDATIIKGNVIEGQVKSEEEKEHLLKAYDIGSMIIKDGYLK